MNRSSASTSVSRLSSAFCSSALERRAEPARPRSPRAATAAGGASRCARSRRRSGRSRSRAGAGATRPASRRGRTCAGSATGSWPSAPGVRPSGSGSSAGSPSGSRPSGSSWAARWPWVRCALSSEVAAWTAWQQLFVRAPRPGAPAGAPASAPARSAGAARARRQRRQRHAEVAEHALVEARLAVQVGLDPLQEPARLGALDDPVVVGRGHRHDLLDAERPRRRARVRPDTRSSRSRRSCPGRSSAAGTEATVPSPPGLVSDTLPPLRSSAVRVFVRAFSTSSLYALEELGEALAPGVADHGHHQRAAAVLALDVDRQAEVAGAVVDPVAACRRSPRSGGPSPASRPWPRARSRTRSGA